MKKEILMLSLLLLAMMINAEPIVRVVSTNGINSAFAMSNVQKLVLSETTVDLVNSEGSLLLSVPLAETARVEFTEGNPDTPTSYDQVQNDGLQCIKVLRNGQLFIIYEGIIYNMQGQVVKYKNYEIR